MTIRGLPFILAAVILAAHAGFASVLDWSAVVWAEEDLTNTYTVDGVDVTITLSGDTNKIKNNYPQINGEQGNDDSLGIYVDFNNLSKEVFVTIAFSSPVTGVSFTLFDVDHGSDNGDGTYTFDDHLRNFSASGGDAGTPSFTTSAANTVDAAGTGVEGNGSNEPATNPGGNVTIDFGSEASGTLTSLSFGYIGGPDSQSKPAEQRVGIHNIHFTPIPETGAIAGLGLFSALVVILHRRHLRRKSQPA